jgi:hypothetical protein
MELVQVPEETCAVCKDGMAYDDNEIVFCGGCNVAVHQLCYGIETIPEGEWYAYSALELNQTTFG